MARQLWRRFVMLLVLVAIGLGAMVARFLIQGGAFHRLSQHVPATCAAVDLGGGTFRDMAVDQTSGVLYVSIAGGGDVTSAIRRLDLKTADAKLEPALSKAPTAFTPDAIGLFSVSGTRRLFVVNRATPGRATVEMFDFGDNGLWTHSANLRDTRFSDPADMVPVGPEAFYLANLPAPRNPFERAMEMLLGRDRGTLIYNNGERTTASVIEMAGAG
jgi:hypothetical protein